MQLLGDFMFCNEFKVCLACQGNLYRYPTVRRPWRGRGKNMTLLWIAVLPDEVAMHLKPVFSGDYRVRCVPSKKEGKGSELKARIRWKYRRILSLSYLFVGVGGTWTWVCAWSRPL